MYDWLTDALQGNSEVITGNQRLARTLRAVYGDLQVRSGRTVWPSPRIRAWQDWLNELADSVAAQDSLPVRINSRHSRLLWERCLAREIGDPLVNIGTLARPAADAWGRLADWRVTLDECRVAARSDDERLFVRAATRYITTLEAENWVDPPGMAGLLTQLAQAGALTAPGRLILVGFDRLTPLARLLLDRLAEAGTEVTVVPVPERAGTIERHVFDDRAGELRAAGAWARAALQAEPGLHIGIVVPGLEQNADSIARLVREGFIPGWQYAPGNQASAVNVSFGRRLADYPAVAIAIRALRWLHADLATTEVSHLLRSPLIGFNDLAARTRAEIRLRELPAQSWSPGRLAAVIRGMDHQDELADLRLALRKLEEFRAEWPQRDRPSGWAERFDAALSALGWPGPGSLDSADFQLVNRWRDLLNELAQTGLVTGSIAVAKAHARLAAMAGETVFQPESESAALQVLGPLEAAGLEFDRLWVSGLSATNWPPPGRPLRLVSWELQRSHGMPDATPADTLDYARRLLQRLLHSTVEAKVSYAASDGDAVQAASALLDAYANSDSTAPEDPGWSAATLLGRVPVVAAPDPVPAVPEDELVAGGAATVQRQMDEPFAAFVQGRLGVRLLRPITPGLAPSQRGNLIHEALHRLYADVGGQSDLHEWSADERSARVSAAARAAARHHGRHADHVISRLLVLERRRITELLHAVVQLDCERPGFRIEQTENALPAVLEGVSLQLRVDRVDRLDDGDLLIIDYKTGMTRALANSRGELQEPQLVVYACAIEGPVGGIALFNVDSRTVAIDGVGAGWRPELNWEEHMALWQESVYRALRDLAKGDVRLRDIDSVDATRPLGLLSRYRELVNEA